MSVSKTALDVLQGVVEQTQRTGGPMGSAGVDLYQLASDTLSQKDEQKALILLRRIAGFRDYSLRCGFRRNDYGSVDALHRQICQLLRRHGVEMVSPSFNEKLKMEKP